MYDPIKYFDEMNLLQEDKERRTATAGNFFDSMLRFFRAQLIQLISGVMLFDKSSAEYESELMDLYFSMIPNGNRYDDAAIEKAHRFARYIEDSTERAIASANGNPEYTASRKLGIGMKDTDVPASVKRMFSDDRANEIALNETNWIYNYLNHKQISETQETHTWVTMKDESVRTSHRLADGQTVSVNEPFIVGGYKMMFPLDDSLGAPIKEIINCRCVEL